ncbi:Ran GTPase-activating protein 1 [Phytophthora megakarya]|uniref:Ran GTPase-activating protein 1 n=1 Tax=Phytophthora megakarya TaxID=4795 RepID=A0A225WQM7_9STRA|nr:Ran GTPase-activating protein 1 [Phytophthora megakarya]
MKEEFSRRPTSRLKRRVSVEEAVTPTAVRAAARASLKQEEIRPATVETPRPAVKLKPRPPSDSSSSNNTKTFLTAIVSGRRRSRRQSELRPPSPLDSVEPSSDYVENVTATEPAVPANYIGTEAMQQFWSIFHRQETVHNNKVVPPSSSNDVGTRPKSARTTYLAAVRNLRLCPEPLGIVRRRIVDKTTSYASGSTMQEVNLSSYRMGNAYAGAFGEGFSLLPGVESLNLSHNRIGDVVAARLITAAATAAATQGTTGLQLLNLSHNALATASSLALVELMRRSRTLTSLNLSHTGLRDREVLQLCESLTLSQTVVRLHLSENRFGMPGTLAIARYLEENARIEELYLAWNQLRGIGALKIVEALKFHASLRVCDLSWNALSSSGPNAASTIGSANNNSAVVLRPRAVVTALADSLANNKVLAHLDLSSNRLDLEDCVLLAKQLESNQTLIGLHMSGNCAVMDSRGFLIPKIQAHDEDSGGSRRLRDQHKLYSITVFEEVHSDAGSGVFPAHLVSVVDASCWYCGLWTEHRFTWSPTAGQGPFAGTTDRFEITPSMDVRLHLSVDDWRGVAMERRENDGDGISFSALRVIPPGPTNYFFTVIDTNANPNSTTNVSYHYVSSRPSRPVHRQRRLVPGKPSSSNLGDNEEAETVAATHGGVFGNLERLNIIRITQRGGRDPCNTLVPRSSGRNSERRGKWDINKSVFARRKRESECRSFVDTDGFIAKACAADWKQCKIDRFVKDPIRRREVEVSVTRWYRTVCNAYRRYCGHNVLLNLAPLGSLTPAAAVQLQNDIACIPWSGYTEFLSEARILDETSEYCSLPDLENVFVAANLELTQEAKEKDNPDRSLTRFEFLECVIRIAMNKYFRTNICDTPAKAVDKLMQENILPVIPEDANEFRSRFLYTEEVSDTFAEHVTLLQELYDANMGRYCKPGEKKGMHLVEFLCLLEKYQVFSDSFRVRDVKDSFLACKLVVLDEMITVGHKKLFLTDFMEIILRVSVIRYPPRTLTVLEVVRSLQKLLINHFCKHDALVGQFHEAVDNALVKDRLEAFTNAINSQRNHSLASGPSTPRGRGGGRSAGPVRRSIITEENNSDTDDDSESNIDDKIEENKNGDIIAMPLINTTPTDQTSQDGMGGVATVIGEMGARTSTDE